MQKRVVINNNPVLCGSYLRDIKQETATLTQIWKKCLEMFSKNAFTL